MNIRYATMSDLDDIVSVESECFPVLEAATKEEFEQRIKYFGNHFWLMFDRNKLIGFVDGMVTDRADLIDDLYAQASLHDEQGAWQMIFGVNTLPEYRRQGVADALLDALCARAAALDLAFLTLEVRASNAPAIALYRKHGFQTVGQRRNYYQKPDEDALLMTWFRREAETI